MTPQPFSRDGRVDVRPRDAVFFSHLRWDFVFQRPQHIVSRWARDHRVIFWEEAVRDATTPHLAVHRRGDVTVVVPHVTEGDRFEQLTLRRLLEEFSGVARLHDPIAWYWTPLMRSFSHHLPFSAVVWDCMDELTAFAFAPPELVHWESRLLADADVVFTGGYTLYEHKRHRHANIHPFPSSVDVEQFAKARVPQPDPLDQRSIPHPRVGWFGVIDERTDLALLDAVAAARPEWHFVMVGPVVKIDPASLPRRANVHWLGMKPYAELPTYVAHWDVAMLPFAHNDATRTISPTKTPEYLAAGRPVVSTSIRDVVRPYGERALVEIADGPQAFCEAIARCLTTDHTIRQRRADVLLSRMSWDATVAAMRARVEAVHERRAAVSGRPFVLANGAQ